MSNPVLKAYPYECVYPNPYQQPGNRRLSGEDFDALVESIRVNGVEQPPPARPHPDLPNAVQLAAGHRRFAAARQARPDEAFYVLVQPLSDLEMIERCIEENIHRSDLNDIEKAQMVEQYKKINPAATNADMARVFRLKDPASISNIRRLLKLPKSIQEQVAANAVPQAIARQLVGIAKVNAKAAQEIANAVAAASPSEKMDVFENQATGSFSDKLINLDAVDWSPDWLAGAPVSVDIDLGEGDHLVPACAGCVFYFRNQNGERCARPACFKVKFGLWSAVEAQRVAQALKLSVLQPGEKGAAVFDTNDYNADDKARVLLHSARKEVRETLRIAPVDEITRWNWGMRRLLDSRAVGLVTVDPAKVKAWFAEMEEKQRGKTPKPSRDDKAQTEETDAQRVKRIEREREAMAAKRAERSTGWRSKYDALWLVENASKLIGERLEIGGEFLKFVEDVFCQHHSTRLEVTSVEERLEDAIEKTKGEEAAALRRQHIALNVISHWGILNRSGNMLDYGNAHERIEDLVEIGGEDGRNFGVKLPTGWDQPPIHRTAFNCWHCGRFAGNMQEKLTKRDIEEDGWIDDGEQGVFCNEDHKRAFLDANAKSPSPRKAAKRGASKKSKVLTKKGKR